MSASDKITKIADEIEEFFMENSCAIKNDMALRKIQSMCSGLGAYDHYIAEKASEIMELSSLLFSARKHKNYRGGAEEIHNRIVHDLLPRIRQRAKNIEYAENNPLP
jgi:hypothetical protein